MLAVLAGAAACVPSDDPDDSSDRDGFGPQATVAGEYRFAAGVDPMVLPKVPTEVWGQMYRPRDLGNQAHPVVVFLHGNHATCSTGENPKREASCVYTFTGACPKGESVIPNHLGYEYLATRLASWGYVVVSINANLGISCNGHTGTDDDGLILARGRLVLRHLALLGRWNREGGAPGALGADLRGKLDLRQVGLMGHSRGGEGMRAAYSLYRDSGSPWPAEIGEPLSVRGIFEIAPVDGLSSRTLDAVGTAWNVLLPTCDGDVSDLQGMKPFDRMLGATGESPALPKSMFVVTGANHNYFNTEWQTSDSTGCVGAEPIWNGFVGSAAQRKTAQGPLIEFFRAHVGTQRDTRLAALFDPRYAIPRELADLTRFERAYVPSPAGTHSFRVETFQGAEGMGSLGAPHEAVGAVALHTVVREHDASLRAAELSWMNGGPETYFQDNWTGLGTGLDLASQLTLDFRVSRADSVLNVDASTDFGIRLALPDGTLGPEVSLSSYADLVGPNGTLEGPHEPLMTVRIPLADLGAPPRARGVRFTFNRTGRGLLHVADIALSARGSDPWPSEPLLALGSRSDGGARTGQPVARSSRAITVAGSDDDGSTARARIARVSRVAGEPGRVEIEVESDVPFQVGDALSELTLGGRRAATGSIAPSGDLRRMVFRVERAVVTSLPKCFEAFVSKHGTSRARRHVLGRLHKSAFEPGSH